jgi:D-alanyl-lipoteichoic acid acyltransferase DltB (MBOAT superfamily)
MLFNSVEFVSWFVPVTLAGFFLLGHWRLERFAIAFLVLMSLFFYAWWRIEYLALLVGSILFNYYVGRLLTEYRSRWLLAFGVAANLGVLGYYKYSLFVLGNINLAFDTSFTMSAVLLPLGISFFTFQQIAYLIDNYGGITKEHSFFNYALFVSFFPQLIAGPIVHHKEILPQFRDPKTFVPNLENLSVGLTIFAIGLFKKVIIADRISVYSTRVFDAAAAGETITFVESWGGAVAFTLQLYFDFSGYSDMAIGLGWLFGIRLPVNFNSPYKAASIIEFWQRWHITLTRFLTAYIYNPIVMSLTRRRMAAGKPLLRRGSMQIGPFVMLLALPSLFTMFVAGVWHGAGFQFIIFGVLHGVYLVINHAWRAIRGKSRPLSPRAALLMRPIGVIITFIAVVVSLVFFRAESVPHALAMLSSMAGLGDIVIPYQYGRYLGSLREGLPAFIELRWLDYYDTEQVMWLLLLMAVVWILPNTQDWVAFHAAKKKDDQLGTQTAGLFAQLIKPVREWSPNHATAILTGLLASLSLLEIVSEAPSEFLYFNF